MSVALTSSSARSIAHRFRETSRLTVRQRKKWIEILLSFEVKNQYDVHDETGQPALRVAEQGTGLGSFLKRMFLGPIRPFEASVDDVQSGERVMVLKRPFRWVFARLEVMDGEGQKIGAIERKWDWIRRIYVIEDANGQPIAELFGPAFKPWTFEIRTPGGENGVIQKKWSGFGKEMFTDADNFGVDFGTISDPTVRALAFAATVLIDVVHFERAKG
jgi:uncharacterized protein YxjI